MDWGEPPQWADDRHLVTPWREFGDASVRITTEVAQIAPAGAPLADATSAQQQDGAAALEGQDLAQPLQIVRMPECASVRPDVVLVVASVGHAASILAVNRKVTHNLSVRAVCRWSLTRFSCRSCPRSGASTTTCRYCW
jgi:hypothetical protein